MKVVVVGAGLAGLSAACELSDLGHRVTVLESRPWVGGKAYAVESALGWRDNGQHVFMGCTTAYAGFLQKLGTFGLTYRQHLLRVPVFDGDGRESQIAAAALPAPLHLGGSFLRYRHLGAREKLQAGRLLLAIWRGGERLQGHARGQVFAAWLAERGQAPSTIERFWDFLIVPTMNCRAAVVDAGDALFVIRHGFLEHRSHAALGVSRAPLSQLHGDPAVRYIEARGGAVRVRARGAEVLWAGDAASGVRLTTGEGVAAEAVVLAVANESLAEAAGPSLATLPYIQAAASLPTAPIVNLHVAFDRPVARWPFAAFAGSPLQWAFNRDVLDLADAPRDHRLVISLSDATSATSMTPTALRAMFEPLLRRAIPGCAGATIVRWDVTKEPHATFIPAPGLSRPGNETPIAGLFLAGAYTDTGWPATMESAVRSGIRAARLVHVRSLASGPPRTGASGG
ncbi:MAG: hydroxysqualene dehydroxylase HpnE [Dehalococcoidia bacterium]